MNDKSISGISGPTVRAKGLTGSFMHEVVNVGDARLLGEIIRIESGIATIQVYEDTEGLKIGEPVELTGELMSVELGPGLIGSIFDGIQRPLPQLAEKWGNFIQRGAMLPRLDAERKWNFVPAVKKGDELSEGMVVGTVNETKSIIHKIMVPQGVAGKAAQVNRGEMTVKETAVTLDNGAKITLRQKSNIREPRKSDGKLPFTIPLLTGQRILDTLYPVAEGGSAIIPGGFGTGKTVLEQTLAKYADADVVIYIGCGERGNEMAEVLHEFPNLKDPYTGGSLMERTILIANTSNMPVAAREASIYTGMTIAEYYRDMGYRVAVMADSTSRWAEALREISSRLEEMPGEEGYPPYLASRLGSFYERAARVRCLGRNNETGSITIIGAVSPPGGDFSEPVTQASMRMASTFWALDYDLAHQRHFPAINWINSFSLSYRTLARWYKENVDKEWMAMVSRVNAILQKEVELSEVVKIIGIDAIGESERVSLDSAQILREGYLRQSSYHPIDAFCSRAKQKKMLVAMLHYITKTSEAISNGFPLEKILASPMRETLLRLMELPESEIDGRTFDLKKEIDAYFKGGVEE